MKQEQTTERHLDTDRDDPALEITEIISEIEGRETDEMTPIWNCIDGALESVFSSPPARHAEVTVSFNYEGYRVTVNQAGTAWFDPQEDLSESG